MEDLKNNIPDIFKEIELTEEQESAFLKFIQDFSKQMKDQIGQYYENKIGQLEKDYIEINEEYENFKENTSGKLEEFKQHAKEANNYVIEEMQKEYSKNLTNSLQQLHSKIEERVKKDFRNSSEYQVLEEIKKQLKPFVISESEDYLVSENENLKAQLEEVKKDRQEIAKKAKIDTIVKDFPKESQETVRNFLARGNTEEEILENFETILGLMEKGGLKLINEDENENDEEYDDYEDEDDEDEDDEDYEDDDDEDDEEDEDEDDEDYNEDVLPFTSKRSNDKGNNMSTEEEQLLQAAGLLGR